MQTHLLGGQPSSSSTHPQGGPAIMTSVPNSVASSADKKVQQQPYDEEATVHYDVNNAPDSINCFASLWGEHPRACALLTVGAIATTVYFSGTYDANDHDNEPTPLYWLALTVGVSAAFGITCCVGCLCCSDSDAENQQRPGIS